MLLRIYAKCLAGQDELAKRRIIEALEERIGSKDAARNGGSTGMAGSERPTHDGSPQPDDKR